jgi:hypothetical protein
MIWSLYMDVYRNELTVLPQNPLAGDSHYLLLSQRDPDVPLEYKPGGYYFNPLFKQTGTGVPHPFIMNGENHLVSVFTGKSPKKLTREKAAMFRRGWFELPPRNLTKEDIHKDLLTLVKAQPKLHGAIAQVARASMGLRIPNGLSISSFDGWLAWIQAQQTPLPLRLKTVFQVVQSRAAALVFSEKDQHRLLTGEEPPPVALVKVRWYKYETVRILRKRIRESAEWEVEMPLSILQDGTPSEEAVIAALDLRYGPGWRSLTDASPSGITDSDLNEEEPHETIEGPLIWFRSLDDNRMPFQPLGPKSNLEQSPSSINDLFQLAIQTT